MDTIEISMLTTIDNPFDPFDQWDDWYRYDEAAGYHSCSYLSRIIQTSDNASEEQREADNTAAIDEIVELDPFLIYRKVTRVVERSKSGL